jgi:hypothetical protein
MKEAPRGVSMERKADYPPEIREAIGRRARELYERSGRLPGHDLQNWCQAEAEIIREHSGRPAIIVKVGGVLYTGEYERAQSGGYQAAEWDPGDPIPVRVAGDKLYLRRPNGRELATTIVKRSPKANR